MVTDGEKKRLVQPGATFDEVNAVDELIRSRHETTENIEKASELKEKREVVLHVEELSALSGEDTVSEDAKPARKSRLMPVNPWVMTTDDQPSTFALDVDTASYDIARRYINNGFLPPKHTVRMLKCDEGEGGPGWPDARIAEAFGVTVRSLAN